MTISVSDFITLVLQEYNAVGDERFSQQLMLDLLWAGQMELATRAKIIESVQTTTTVASQQQYSQPENAMAIYRVEYNGEKVDRLEERRFDAMSLSNSTTAVTGTPLYYKEFSRVLYLLPTPNAARTLKIYSYNAPQRLTIASNFEVPDEFVLSLKDYCLWRMAAMDKNTQVSANYKDYWDMAVARAVEWSVLRKHQEGFGRVLCEEEVRVTLAGSI